MSHRALALGTALLLCVTASLLGWSASRSVASASLARPRPSKSPSPSPSPSPNPAGTFIKAYSAIVNGTQLDLSPVDVQATSDGGSIALAEAESPQGLGVDWLLKLSATGSPQWQEQVGCVGAQRAPGDNADGVSVQQTADGGYVVAGGTVDCGSGTSCPALSGQSCALVEKLDPAGKVTWAHAYAAGPDGSSFKQIRQTADGGYIAAGSFTNSSQNTGGLLIKLDSAGNVQWQRELGPAGSTSAYFNTVEQSADGSYVAAGGFYTPAAGPVPAEVLVARFAADGGLSWQHGFATLGSDGSPASVTDANSVIQTSDGGYAVAGRWSDDSFNSGNGARGALLLKLNASGGEQWQQVYSGGVDCFVGYGENCADIGAISYSLHQASDGGYVLAGDSNLELSGEVPLVPWLAKTDNAGTLLWQHLYYQTYTTGAPLSEDFQGSAPVSGGRFIAAGPTLNYGTQKEELYAVRTDSSGLAGNCSDVHAATPLQAINPQLTAVAPSLPLQTDASQAADAPIGTLTTSVSTQQDC